VIDGLLAFRFGPVKSVIQVWTSLFVILHRHFDSGFTDKKTFNEELKQELQKHR
jgi:hypothetical protein